MAHFTIRAPRFPDDFEAIARLSNFVRPEPISVEQLATWQQSLPQHNTVTYDEQGRLTGYFRERLVATTRDGQVVGYAETNREESYHPGEMNELLLVDPEHRNQGIGTALHEQIHAQSLALRPTAIHVDFPDSLPASRAYAEKRGYLVDRHLFNSRLDLASFDEIPFVGIIEGVEASGIRFLTLDQWRAFSDDRSLYEEAKASHRDIPGTPPPPPYSDWLTVINEAPENFTLVAMDGERFAGITHLQLTKVTGNGYNYYTGLNREYRGRKISLALKLLSIRIARQANLPYLTTFNDSENAPMIAINQKLGYERAPGHYIAKKTVLDADFVSESSTKE
jgi:GNAT superfamily N-acetyltransferase